MVIVRTHTYAMHVHMLTCWSSFAYQPWLVPAEKATEARKFAALNYLGMRKICRKLDKLLSEHREGEKTKGMNYFDERMPETCLAVSTVSGFWRERSFRERERERGLF